mmetsp:Transcript_1994/g.4489  ORF Transcript_1994/g.4489 Transcript_1994/m.4489 type:complete len:419 (-) Transcript_1994:23-1279(-)
MPRSHLPLVPARKNGRRLRGVLRFLPKERNQRTLQRVADAKRRGVGIRRRFRRAHSHHPAAHARQAVRRARHAQGERAQVQGERRAELPLHARAFLCDVVPRVLQPRARARAAWRDHRGDQPVRAWVLRDAHPEGALRAEQLRQRRMRQSHLRLLLGYGAVPTHRPARPEDVHQLPVGHDAVEPAPPLLHREADGTVRKPERRDARVRDPHRGVRLQVLRLGGGLHEVDRHHARPRWILHLLGMPRLGAVAVHEPVAVLRAQPRSDQPRNGGIHAVCWPADDLGQLRRRSPACGLPHGEWPMQRVGQARKVHQGKVRHGERPDQGESPPSQRVLGNVASLPLPPRDPRVVLLVRTRLIQAYFPVLLRHLPHDPARGSGSPRRRTMRRQVRQILGPVQKAGVVLDCARRVLKVTFHMCV